MKKVKEFLNHTKWVSRIFFLLAIVWMALCVSLAFFGLHKQDNIAFSSVIYGGVIGAIILFIPVVVIEYWKNPLINTPSFIKDIKWFSCALIIVWLETSFLISSGVGYKILEVASSLFFGTVVFLFPVIIIEYKTNPSLIANRKERTARKSKKADEAAFPGDRGDRKSRILIDFLKSTKVISRVLFGLWILFSIAGAGNIASNYLFTIPIMSIFFLLPACIVEYNKNPIIKNLRKKRAAKREAIREEKHRQTEDKQKANAYKGVYLSEQQIYNLENHIELPALVDSPILLSQGEVAVYYCKATRQEIRNRTFGKTGRYGGGTVRLANGLSSHVGCSFFRPIDSYVPTYYEGKMVITNMRIVFLSDQKGFGLRNNDVKTTTVYSYGLCIQSDSHTYTLLLPKAELAAIAFEAVRTGELSTAGKNARTDYSFTDSNDPTSIHVDDDLFKDAVDMVIKTRQTSEFILHNMLGIGYSRAERLFFEMEKHGIVSPFEETKSRSILVSQCEWEEIRQHIVCGKIDKNNTEFDSDGQKIKHHYGITCIDGMNGHDFEFFCADILRKNSFSDVKVTPGSGDQGVDILAEKGGVKYAIQCKNYASQLSNTPVQEVNAGKTFYGCHVGVVMTNSTFTPGAVNLAKATNVILWDRAIVEKMMCVEDY